MLHRKCRRKVVLRWVSEFYQYPIKNCKYPISLTVKGKDPIPQKKNICFSAQFSSVHLQEKQNVSFLYQESYGVSYDKSHWTFKL